MKIRNLADIELFIRTAECGGLTAAAKTLNLSPAVASAALKRLEADLGILLLVRTTRSLRLTPEGERLLSRAKPLLEELREIENELTNDQRQIKGTLSVSMPSGLGRHLILPWLDEFQNLYPDLHLRLQLTDRISDFYKEPVDIAIRYGNPADSNHVALPLVKQNFRVACAAPVYLAQRKIPAHPHELSEHNNLCFCIGDTLYNRWRFKKTDLLVEVEVKGDRSADDADAVRQWALAGYGVCYRSWLDVAKDIQENRLQKILLDWQGEAVPLNMICADRRQISPAIRLVKNYLEKQFSTYLIQLQDVS